METSALASGIHNTPTHCQCLYEWSSLCGNCNNFYVWKWETKHTNKGKISISCLILVYTIQQPDVHVCSKFQLCKLQNFRNICEDHFNMYILDRQKNNQINEQSDSGILVHET